ncbi:MAG: efflux RND transporter periplasmic adaptor subunit [Marinovum algicola]|uniref:efflux RND transporter periplasmic adaptor subunit n=1 Tax=Marinovum algicola TaxID=42444 RepID=UPI0032EF473E
MAERHTSAAVLVDSVDERAIDQTVPVLGRLVARQAGVVAVRVAERVVAIDVQVGDRVERGDILARLSDDRLESERRLWAAAVEAAKATVARDRAFLTKAQQAFARHEQLEGSTAYRKDRAEDAARDVDVARADLARSEAELAAATARLGLVETALADATIRAPYDGVVTVEHLAAGAYARVGDPIVTLMNDSDVEIEADVPADRLSALPSGTSVEAEVQNGGDIVVTVRAVVPEENPRTRTRAVRFTVEAGALDYTIAANQSVLLHIPIGGSRKVLTVSKDAIVRIGERSQVFVVIDGKALAKTVQLGESVGSRYQVLQGLLGGDTVVVRGNESLRSGQPVRVEF